VFASSAYCLMTASRIEKLRTGIDRGQLLLTTHSLVWFEYVRVNGSLESFSQGGIVERAASVHAATASMTNVGVHVNYQLLADQYPTLAARVTTTDAARRLAVEIDSLQSQRVAAFDGGHVYLTFHEKFDFGKMVNGRGHHSLMLLPRNIRNVLRAPPGRLVISLDFCATDIYSCLSLTNGAAFPGNDQYMQLAEVLSKEPLFSREITLSDLRDILKSAVISTLYGSEVRETLIENGFDSRGAERAIVHIQRFLRRDILARAVSFFPDAVSVDGGISKRTPSGSVALSAAAEAASWSRRAINMLVARVTSVACTSALVALHSATNGLSPELAASLLAAEPGCEDALIAGEGGGLRLDAELVFWLHDVSVDASLRQLCDCAHRPLPVQFRPPHRPST
jgi:hypothetical protein